MKLTCLAPWMGSKRTLAPRIVTELGTHSYYFEACAGSMAVLFAKEPTGHETVCDLHLALTNLAWCVRDEPTATYLFNLLNRTMYSDELYADSKGWLDTHHECPDKCHDPEHAYHYFVASWMGRNGVAGTARVNYQIATRWTKGGGSGPLRFRNAVDSIPAWCERLRNVHILRRDLFDVLPKIEDDDGVAIYADPPYIEEGDKYLHGFKPEDHARLAKELSRFRKARVVVSYYAHPKLESLYSGWTFLDCSRQKHLHVQNKRGTGGKEAPEVLILNGPSFVRPAAAKATLFPVI